MDSEPEIPQKGDSEAVITHLSVIVGDENFIDLTDHHLSENSELLKLVELRDKYGDEEYLKAINLVAGKVAEMIAGKIKRSIAEVIEDVHKEMQSPKNRKRKNRTKASQPDPVPQTAAAGPAADAGPKQEEIAEPEVLEGEYLEYAEDFILKNFRGLIDPKSNDVRKTMKEAARKARFILEKYDLHPSNMKHLTKLALYDFVILCDDSSSMKFNTEHEDRISPLKKTLEKIAEIATLIEPSGISIRFLNYKKDGAWDNLKGMKDMNPLLKKVPWAGATKLGTVLNKKIVQPLVIEKVNNGTFKKPLIVVIITDGKPERESPGTFNKTIMDCKNSKEVQSFGEAAVVFVLSRVGSAAGAEKFLTSLKESAEDDLKDWVYCSMDRLDDNAAFMKRAQIISEANGDKEYAKKLLQIFIAALQQQTAS
ncbi:hypothetical protein Dda_7356 [Drechslerella dactyloides]|uniref:VWFA domain-containing protein n=1 Tax=Drechslerella dactyloides TaxID=74499 RepID=A0AAD6ISG9_DREDA|nr:hypothetical protein Dda_7356 [Drechslerella dactyloides]